MSTGMLPFLSSDFHWCCQHWRRIFRPDGCYKMRAAGRNWSRRNYCWLLGILHSWIGYPHIHFAHRLRRNLDPRQFRHSTNHHSELNFPTIADNCLFKSRTLTCLQIVDGSSWWRQLTLKWKLILLEMVVVQRLLVTVEEALRRIRQPPQHSSGRALLIKLLMGDDHKGRQEDQRQFHLCGNFKLRM